MRRLPVVLCLAALTGCPATESDTGTEAGGTTDTANTTTTGAGTSTGSSALTGDGTSTGVDPTPTTGEGPGTTSGVATGDGTSTGTTGGVDTGEAWTPKGCPEIYAEDILPTFELEIDADVLAALEHEWAEADDNDLAEHPLAAFRYQDIVITNASIRLRGNASHWPTQGKMQFEIQFNTFAKKGRFMGLRQVLFDAAEYNRSFLRDRLALAILRDAGVPAPCANNARLVVNGEYYGLFTSIEKVDKEFLERHFENSDGNLYKRGGGGSLDWTKKTNEEIDDLSDIEQLEAADDIGDLLARMNLDQAIVEWAAEAVIPDRDGLWAGGLNGYTYNDPNTGFTMIPWDLDDSFTRVEPDIDPVTWKKPADVFHGRPFYDIALADPEWFQRYIDAVEHVVTTAYQVDVLHQRIDAWSAQIAEAAEDDPNRPFTFQEHLDKVEEKREFVAERAEFLAGWLACWKGGGTKGPDGICVPP
jgi:spore coat protein CotH